MKLSWLITSQIQKVFMLVDFNIRYVMEIAQQKRYQPRLSTEAAFLMILESLLTD